MGRIPFIKQSKNFSRSGYNRRVFAESLFKPFLRSFWLNLLLPFMLPLPVKSPYSHILPKS